MLIDKLQKLLKLQDWQIDYIEVPALDNQAQTKLVYNDYHAVIEVNAELSAEEKERSTIHEMLHLIFRDAYDIFSENVNDEFARKYCEKQHERAIEKTAKIIYELLKGKALINCDPNEGEKNILPSVPKSI